MVLAGDGLWGVEELKKEEEGECIRRAWFFACALQFAVSDVKATVVSWHRDAVVPVLDDARLTFTPAGAAGWSDPPLNSQMKKKLLEILSACSVDSLSPIAKKTMERTRRGKDTPSYIIACVSCSSKKSNWLDSLSLIANRTMERTRRRKDTPSYIIACVICGSKKSWKTAGPICLLHFISQRKKTCPACSPRRCCCCCSCSANYRVSHPRFICLSADHTLTDRCNILGRADCLVRGSHYCLER